VRKSTRDSEVKKGLSFAFSFTSFAIFLFPRYDSKAAEILLVFILIRIDAQG